MRPVRLLLALAIGSVLSVSAAVAQLAPVNAAAVTMSHVQLNVRDVEASRKFYLQLGGTPVKWGRMEGIKYPGVIFFFARAEPTGGMEGSSVDHIGFTVREAVALFTRMQAQGVKTASNGLNAQGQIYGGYVYSPDGAKIELIERATLTVPLQFDQVHFFVADPGPAGGPAWSEVQTWYTKVFGANATRTVLTGPAANNPASAPMSQSTMPATTNLRFSPAPSSVPTKGRALNHIGFEVRNLEAFSKQLEATGVKLAVPYRLQDGIGTAYLIDPKGTYIQLTEGLGKL
jgi:catechol 2,3-dioxygenase-like lactoylglutathione lyase family enzyme